MKNLSVRSRLGMLVVAAAIAVIVIKTVSLLQWRSELYSAREAEIQSLVDTAVDVVQSQLNLTSAESTDKEAAQLSAIKLIEQMKYRGNEYFFIFDAKARVVAHGGKPELKGKDYSAIRTKDGDAVFSRMANLAPQSDTGGLFAYNWPKAGNETPQPKISYVASVGNSEWVLGTGVYVDDIEAAFLTELMHFLWQLAVIIGVLLALAIPIIRMEAPAASA